MGSEMQPYYSDDAVTLYLGDCREVWAAIASPVDLLLTDPPYGIDSVKKDGKMGGSVAASNRVYERVHGDDAPLDPTWLLGIGRRRMIWGAEHFTTGIPSGGRLLVWDKREGTASNDLADIETAWDSAGGPSRLYHHRQMGMIHDGYGDVDRWHPNQKPLAVMLWCLLLAPEARVVLDLYAGSGTVLRAAKDLGRQAIGVEINESYCERIAVRMSQGVLSLGGAA